GLAGEQSVAAAVGNARALVAGVAHRADFGAGAAVGRIVAVDVRLAAVRRIAVAIAPAHRAATDAAVANRRRGRARARLAAVAAVGGIQRHVHAGVLARHEARGADARALHAGRVHAAVDAAGAAVGRIAARVHAPAITVRLVGAAAAHVRPAAPAHP